jgi:hypothetical protein
MRTLLSLLALCLAAAEPAERLAAAAAACRAATETALYQPEAARAAFRACAIELESIRAAVGAVHPRYDATVGTVWALAGEPAQAIRALRAAERALPGDPHIAANLAFARSQRTDALPDVFVPAWLQDLSLPALPRWLAPGLFLLGWLLLWTLVVVRRRGGWMWVAAGGLLLIGGLPLSARLAVDRLGSDGVVTAPATAPRTGDGHLYPQATTAPLHAGTEVRRLRQRGDWVEVRLSDGHTCWLHAGAITAIR